MAQTAQSFRRSAHGVVHPCLAYNFGPSSVATPKTVGETGTGNFGLFHLVGVDHQGDGGVKLCVRVVSIDREPSELLLGIFGATFAYEPPGTYN